MGTMLWMQEFNLPYFNDIALFNFISALDNIIKKLLKYMKLFEYVHCKNFYVKYLSWKFNIIKSHQIKIGILYFEIQDKYSLLIKPGFHIIHY